MSPKNHVHIPAYSLWKFLGHLKFNRHFLKSIFDLLTLNRFPNGFLHCTRGCPKKIHDIFPAPYWPPNPLFHFLVSPLLLFGAISR